MKVRPADERADRDLLDDPDLIEFTSRLPEARKVSIQKMNPESGNWRHKGSLSVDSFTLDNVQRRYKGGTYKFSIHAADGKLLKTISNIEIDDPEEDEEAEPAAKTAAVAHVGSSEIQMLREQMSADRLLIMKLIDSRNQAPPQSSVTELVTALVQLNGMQPKHTQPPEVQDLLMKSFTSGLELAAKINKTAGGGGDGSPLGEILGFAREVFQDARPIIQAALANAAPRGPAQTVPPGTTLSNPEGDEMDESEIDLKPALNFVKEQLNKGTAPSSLANIVLGQMELNPELDETLSAIIAEQPIENFLEVDPELKAEPLRTKFGQFFGVMRARILAARDSRRDSGNPANTGKDADPNSRVN